jgi:membrane associated rhomboid family serine protease
VVPIPIGDENPTSRRPAVNLTLIALNGLVFLWLNVVRGEGGFEPTEHDIRAWGLVPGDPEPSRVLTSLFVHAGPLHLIGNMWFLHIFGDNVEDKLGRGRYLMLYLGWGIAATLAFLLFGKPGGTAGTQAAAEALQRWREVPLVGASGAISGVMGAYLVFFPRARIRMIVFLLFFIYPFVVPALLVIGLYFLQDLLLGVWMGTRPGGGGGVAYAAHTGGMVAGVIAGLALKSRLRKTDGESAWDRDTGFAPGGPVFDDGDGAAPYDGPRSIPLPDLRDQLVGAVLDGRMDLALDLHGQWMSRPRGELLPPVVEMELAHELFRRGRVEDAAAAYLRYLDDHPRGPDAAEAKFRLGMIHVRALGDRDRAREWLRQAAAEHRDPETVAFARRELDKLRG